MSMERIPKNKIMRLILLLIFCFSYSIAFCQSLSEAEIKQLSQKINEELRGIDIGNGITIKGSIAIGRTLIYQYEVPEYWQPPENFKDEIIANSKTGGYASTYFKNNINVDYYYYKGNSLVEKISVNSNEFSTLNFKLGEYLNLKNHPKGKEVNIKLKVPEGWEVKEGDRPNILKKFLHDTNTYLVLIRNNMTFFSRNESRELLSDDEFVNEFIKGETSFFKKPQLLNQRIVTVDKYPTLEFKVKGSAERTGYNFEMIMKCWIIFYEDKLVYLQAVSLNENEFRTLEQLYTQITNSVIFPDQYN